MFNARLLTLTTILAGALCSASPALAVKSTTATRVTPVTDANIVGHILDAKTGEHLPGITVQLKGTSYGTATDASGHFYLRNLKPGRYTILVTGIGYLSQEKMVDIRENNTVEINISLQEDVLNLDEVVVSSNRQATLRKHTPTLVSVVDDRIFNMTNAVALSQGLTFQPGLRVENNCQNCGFNQVRINGLDGHFSQILVDSRPIFSALAGVYGLEQIPANMISHVEVVRGGGSALYGSNAIAGVVNIITKEPLFNSFSFHENLTFTGMKSPDNTIGFNGTVVGADGRIGAMLFGQTRNRGTWDANGDGFSEIGQIKSHSLGSKVFFRISNQDKLSAEIHAIHEDRRGGDRLDLPVHAAAVAEATQHNIYSGGLTYNHFSKDRTHRLQLFTSGQIVDRNSYYGGIGEGNVGRLGFIPKGEFGTNYGVTKGQTYVAGAQYTYDFDRLFFSPAQLLLGLEYNYDALKDNMPIRSWEPDATGKAPLHPGVDQRIHVLSQLGQIEWTSDQWTLLLGARLDEHSAVRSKNGGIRPIFSPRATLRYNPVSNINLRASYAKGFRAPQVFDEDLHVAVVNGESKRVNNNPELRPEYSHSFSLSSDMYFSGDHVQSNLLVEGFYTKLIGAFNTEFVETKNGFNVYERVNGSNATVMGVNIEGKVVFDKVSLQGGLTYAHSQWDEAQEWGVRCYLVGEAKGSEQDINTLTDQGPTTLAGFKQDVDSDGNATFGDNVSMTSKEMLRTPKVYGYLMAEYRPIKPLSLAMTLNYTGRMYAPHVVEVGRNSATVDRELIAAGKRPNTVDIPNAPKWDRLEKTPNFFDLGAKIAYDFKLFNTSQLQLYMGAYNLLNSFQKDYDFGGFRDSGYIVGPLTPRSFYCGMKINI